MKFTDALHHHHHQHDTPKDDTTVTSSSISSASGSTLHPEHQQEQHPEHHHHLHNPLHNPFPPPSHPPGYNTLSPVSAFDYQSQPHPSASHAPHHSSSGRSTPKPTGYTGHTSTQGHWWVDPWSAPTRTSAGGYEVIGDDRESRYKRVGGDDRFLVLEKVRSRSHGPVVMTEKKGTGFAEGYLKHLDAGKHGHGGKDGRGRRLSH